ncbi:MAG: signal peptidase I [Clostridia bacterium]|nr:signal peptidase I [Clostridia bacterium]
MKKVLKVLGSVFTTLLVVFTVFVMIFTIVSFNTVGKQESTILGYKPNIVLTDSMQGVFRVGDIVVSKHVDPKTIKEGDVITFNSIDPASYYEVITHKVKAVTQHEGQLAFTTYGTTTGDVDPYPALSSEVQGIYKFRIPKLGYLFQFLKKPAGYFTIILIPFLLLIGMQAVKFFKLVKQYRKEQQEVLEEQRAEMETERLKAQEMMDELNRLRAQLGDSGDTPPAPSSEEAPPEA